MRTSRLNSYLPSNRATGPKSRMLVIDKTVRYFLFECNDWLERGKHLKVGENVWRDLFLFFGERSDQTQPSLTTRRLAQDHLAPKWNDQSMGNGRPTSQYSRGRHWGNSSRRRQTPGTHFGPNGHMAFTASRTTDIDCRMIEEGFKERRKFKAFFGLTLFPFCSHAQNFRTKNSLWTRRLPN